MTNERWDLPSPMGTRCPSSPTSGPVLRYSVYRRRVERVCDVEDCGESERNVKTLQVLPGPESRGGGVHYLYP